MTERHPASAREALVPSSPTVMANGRAAPAGHADIFRIGWLLLWMSGTLASFIVAAVSVRALSDSLNAFEMMSIRSAGGIAILLAMGLARPEFLRGVTFRQMRLQFVRNAAHFGSQI